MRLGFALCFFALFLNFMPGLIWFLTIPGLVFWFILCLFMGFMVEAFFEDKYDD